MSDGPRHRRFPGLTLRQPYAWAALHGMDVINMTWYTSRRAPFWLHAGNRARVSGKGLVDPHVLAAWQNSFEPGHTPELRAGSPLLVSGAIIALAEVTGCHDANSCNINCSPWAKPGYWHWEISRPLPLAEPVGCRGWLVWGWVPRSIDELARRNLPC